MMAVCVIQSTDAAVPILANWYADVDAGNASIYKTYPGSTRQSGPTWNLDVGYKVFRYLGLEAAFTRYPNKFIKTTDGISAFDSHYSYDVAVRGILPLWHTGLELYGKLGVGKLNSSVEVNGATSTPIFARNHYATSALLGVGAQYYLLSNLALGVQGLYASGDNITGKILFYGVGASVLFG